MFYLSISDDPKVISGNVIINKEALEYTINWIKLNKDLLLEIEEAAEEADITSEVYSMMCNLKMI